MRNRLSQSASSGVHFMRHPSTGGARALSAGPSSPRVMRTIKMVVTDNVGVGDFIDRAYLPTMKDVSMPMRHVAEAGAPAGQVEAAYRQMRQDDADEAPRRRAARDRAHHRRATAGEDFS